ncbi:MAG: hypothetical protein QGD88_12475, partial [Anaerolineae bacterium]|nr:hypothetical protein [Anaerolineae bacterium]
GLGLFGCCFWYPVVVGGVVCVGAISLVFGEFLFLRLDGFVLFFVIAGFVEAVGAIFAIAAFK